MPAAQIRSKPADVLNPDDLGDIMDAMMDSFKLAVTEEVVLQYMMAFEYPSAHSKVEASLRASELIDPVYRLVRATRLGDILSEPCAAKDALVRARLACIDDDAQAAAPTVRALLIQAFGIDAAMSVVVATIVNVGLGLMLLSTTTGYRVRPAQ